MTTDLHLLMCAAVLTIVRSDNFKMETKSNKKILEKAKEAKSADELKAIFEKEKLTLTTEQADELFAKLSKSSGELTDEDLESVTGGWSYRELRSPVFR